MEKKRRISKFGVYTALILVVILAAGVLLAACDNSKIVADYYLDTVNANNYTVEVQSSDNTKAVIYRTENMLYYCEGEGDAVNEFYFSKEEDGIFLNKKDSDGMWAKFPAGEGATLDFLPVITSNFSSELTFDSAHNVYAAKEEILQKAKTIDSKEYTAIMFTLADDYAYLKITAHYQVSGIITMKETYTISNVGTTEINLDALS